MATDESKVEEIFFCALEKGSAEELAAYLDEACEGDEPLRHRVQKLLDAKPKLGSFLQGDAANIIATLDQPITEKPGTQIGPYKLLQQLGEGGMGVVYLAEQKEPVKRRVALKIIKPGMDTRQVIARFEAERQALAMMDHPNIAKVFDAGATESGRPYFAMELVNGLPVTTYCDEQHLTPKERLELFLPICRAVQHAHQKGIIHRDLKPSNILVAMYDNEAVPKIIDFGVAKATNQTLTEKTMFTQLGQVVGTLEYMSPEQAKQNQLDIDTRSDIYSLGVVLYELLTGETPFDRERLRSAAFDEMLRIIREEEPSKPSTKVSSSVSLPSIAANRRIQPAKLKSVIRGELDWIVMKAIEKDRGRRYETASKFAEDVQHHLNDEPVVAGPPSTAYRLLKFVRRKRAILTSAAALLLMLGVGSFAFQQWRSRDRAYTLIGGLQSAHADDVHDFIEELQGNRWARSRMQDLVSVEPQTVSERRGHLHLRMALVRSDDSHVQPLVDELLRAEISYVGPICESLRHTRQDFVSRLWQVLHETSDSNSRRFRAGLALAELEPASDSWTDADASFLAAQLVDANPIYQRRLFACLAPLKNRLLPHLEEIFGTSTLESTQVGAANAIASFVPDESVKLALLLAEATPAQYQILYPLVDGIGSSLLPLESLAQRQPTDGLGFHDRLELGRRRAGAAITLIRQGQWETALDALRVTDDAETLTQFVHRCRERGITAMELLDGLRRADNVRATLTGEARKLEDSVIFGLLLALGEFEMEDLPVEQRQPLLDRLARWYANDPSSGIHGACRWLLFRWRHYETVRQVDQDSLPYSPQREWFRLRVEMDTQNVSGQSQQRESLLTFVVFPAGEYVIGSPTDEVDRESQEEQHRVLISQPFAVLDRELTAAEFEPFLPALVRACQEQAYLTSPYQAVVLPHWYDSVLYCRWLTQKRGLGEQDQAYDDPLKLLSAGAAPDPDPQVTGAPQNWPMRLDRPGFRLPTEAEWEIACRGGLSAGGAYSFGRDASLLDHYGWHEANSGRGVHEPSQLRPNLRGLFDMHGNVIEWCHDWQAEYSIAGSQDPVGPPQGSAKLGRGGCWSDAPRRCRAATRDRVRASGRYPYMGFRLALSLIDGPEHESVREEGVE